MGKDLVGIKAVIFDWDDTLVDSQTGAIAAHNSVAGKLKAWLEGEGIKVAGSFLRERVRAFDDKMNRLTRYDRDSWWPKLVNELGFEVVLPGKLIEELTRTYWSSLADSSSPYEDTLSTLEWIKERGYQLGLISDTDSTPGIKRWRISRFKFHTLFQVIVVSGEDVAHIKPHPESFEYAAKCLDLSCGECVFVGDKLFTDIKGANAAGMHTVLIHRRDWDSPERADYVIKSLSELRELFRGEV